MELTAKDAKNMLTLPEPIANAERAVNQYKHALLVRVMTVIVQRALVQPYVSAGDVPEDIVEKEHRQGVASNAWNVLRSLEIIEAVPLALSDESRGIFGGRIQNKNPHRKGSWVAAYRLRSREAALTWASANGVRVTEPEPTAATPVQQDFTIN